MENNLKKDDKLVFQWFGTNKIGFVQSIHKYKENNVVYYRYDIRGEDKKVYKDIPILEKNSNLGINLNLTKKI